MLRDERLVIRQFETETDRAVAVVVDASASMAFRGPSAPDSKLAFASLIAAALGRVALGGGDPVGLSFIGADGHARGVDKSAGREQFDRIVASLDAVTPRGDAYGDPAMLERALGTLARTCRRGDVVVLLSDLLDESDGDAQRVAALASRGCVLSVVQVLDPAEVELPYRGTVRFRALEGTAEVEIDADRGRREYRARLGEISDRWKLEVTRRGGRFQIAQTSDDPVQVVRTIVQRLRR
jgi:uncharacterized protein (DUF58 family)